MTDQNKGFHTAATEIEERCIARRSSTGAIEVWSEGRGWIVDSDLATIFPGQKELDDYIKANPALAGEQNLKVIKTRQ